MRLHYKPMRKVVLPRGEGDFSATFCESADATAAEPGSQCCRFANARSPSRLQSLWHAKPPELRATQWCSDLAHRSLHMLDGPDQNCLMSVRGPG